MKYPKRIYLSVVEGIAAMAQGYLKAIQLDGIKISKSCVQKEGYPAEQKLQIVRKRLNVQLDGPHILTN